MERRRFLALFGMGGAAAVGAAGANAMGNTSSAGAAEDPRREQRNTPNSGSHRVIWNVETTEPVASLTFDDGPDPDYTPAILDVLGRYDVKATFFMMGRNAEVNDDLTRRVIDEGHEIGNHTWSHENLSFASAAKTFEEMHRAAEVLEAITGAPPKFFRPPRGQLSGFSIRHAALLGSDTILWSVTPAQVSEGSPTDVRRHLAEHLGAGDIVCLHDGIGRGTFKPEGASARRLSDRRNVEIDALGDVIEDALGRGLRFGTVSDLLDVERPESVPSMPVHPADVVAPTNGGAREKT